MSNREQQILDKLDTVLDQQEKLMSTISDLTAAVTRNTTDVQALVTAVQAAIANPNTTIDPTDQAALDAAVQQLGTSDTAAEGAEPATPPAAPTA
jgi:predicted  nucleic acid-binding Zn-ribbon protein